jgi:hypothetical protein
MALGLQGRIQSKTNSSAEHQARRSGSDASVAQICAGAPPKLIEIPLFAQFRDAVDFFSGYR